MTTVAAVLLYRLISFWAAVPIGWLAWALVALFNRSAAGARATTVAHGAPVPTEGATP